MQCAATQTTDGFVSLGARHLALGWRSDCGISVQVDCRSFERQRSQKDEMNSSKDILQMAAQSIPRVRYAVEIVLDKNSEEAGRQLVARRVDHDLVTWMKLNVPGGSRYVYALVESTLAKLFVTDIGAEKGGGYDGDEWLVDASRIWVWKGPFLPDGVNPERPMIWAPFIPPNSTFMLISIWLDES
jgi:hypothetical protein